MIFPRLYYFTPPPHSEPDWQTTYFRHLLKRANALLTNRNPREIQYMLDSLHYVLNQGFPALLKDADSTGSVNINPAAILKAQMVEIDIADQSDLPDARWPEYFAALAVGLCESAFLSELECLDPPVLRLDSELIGHATEAVVLAEILANGVPSTATEVKADKKISLKRQEAAIKRWAATNEIKERFVTEFRNGMFEPHSVMEAARRFYKRLSETECRTLSNSQQGAVRNLTEYWRKQQSPDS